MTEFFAALVGALVGGLIAVLIDQKNAERERRREVQRKWIAWLAAGQNVTKDLAVSISRTADFAKANGPREAIVEEMSKHLGMSIEAFGAQVVAEMEIQMIDKDAGYRKRRNEFREAVHGAFDHRNALQAGSLKDADTAMMRLMEARDVLKELMNDVVDEKRYQPEESPLISASSV